MTKQTGNVSESLEKCVFTKGYIKNGLKQVTAQKEHVSTRQY